MRRNEYAAAMLCLHDIAAVLLRLLVFALLLLRLLLAFALFLARLLLTFALFLLRFSCDFCCVPGRCILNLLFAFSRMIFPALMHLKFAIQALRDAFRR